MNIHIAPIPESFLQRVRSDGTDDLGQPVKRLIAEGGEPCRDVLRRARPGEELILASFSPFEKSGPYHEYGPVFVLAEAEADEAERGQVPVPNGYLRDRFALRAYSHDEAIVDARLVNASEAEQTIERFLQSPEVSFVHARFPAYGCFACRIDRA